MIKTKYKVAFTAFLLIFLLAVASCGKTEAPVEANSSGIESTTEPTAEPTQSPFIEPEMGMSTDELTVDGINLNDGLRLKNGIRFIKLSELTKALGSDCSAAENGTFVFKWRKSDVQLYSASTNLEYKGNVRALESAPILCDGGNDVFVPIESLCDALDIGVYYDEECSHLYCTPASGNWDIPQDFDVPVFMYHGVAHGSEETNLFVSPENLEDQFNYLLNNGYSPIWFEDIEHIEDYEKPVILCFDDGWANNYTNLLPLCVEYGVKATIFIVCEDIKHELPGNHLSNGQMHEIYDSGLIQLQCHSMTHGDLSTMGEAEQNYELIQSKIDLTREFGKEPYVFCYPAGTGNGLTLDLVRENYRFGVMMVSDISYNTSDDPVLVYRFWPQYATKLNEYISWLEKTFPE